MIIDTEALRDTNRAGVMRRWLVTVSGSVWLREITEWAMDADRAIAKVRVVEWPRGARFEAREIDHKGRRPGHPEFWIVD